MPFISILSIMSLDEFWRVIDEARAASAKLTEMPGRLVESLAQIDEREIIDFAEHFRNYLYLSYDANLWLAAVVIMGGCGDDTFTDFRCWLIAQGREVFEAALADPDSLAGVESFDGEEGSPTLFYLIAVDQKAFCKRMAGDEDDEAARSRFEELFPLREHPEIRNEELINTSDEDARALFPKLAARFPNGIQ